MLEIYFAQTGKHILKATQTTIDKELIEKVYSKLFMELRRHGGEVKWFRGSRLAEGNFKNELAAADGHILWLNQDFYQKKPEKALALSGHLFMHMVQWNNNSDQLAIARERFSFRASQGEPIPASEFSNAYAYEKNAWEMFLGFLISTAPHGLKPECRQWLQAQFEEDMFSTDPKGLGLACIYGASDPKTGQFYAQYQKELEYKELDQQLRADYSWTKKFRDKFRFRTVRGIDPFILKTGPKLG